MTESGWNDLLSGGRALRLARLMLVIVLHAGGNYMVVTLGPSIVADVGGGVLIGALTALFNVTTVLAAAVTAPLANRMGSRSLLRVLALACAIGALVSATATTMPAVAVGRAIAGFGGGGLLALAFIALRAQSTVAAWPKLSAINGVFWIGAAFAGPLLGGLLADSVGWRAAFGLLGALGLGYAALNRSTMGALDLSGGTPVLPLATLGALGTGVTLIGFAPLVHPAPMALSVGTAGLILLFLAARRDRARAPRVFPRAAFRFDTDQGRAVAAKLLLGAGAMSVLVYGPLLLIEAHDRSATFAGAFVLIETMSWSAGSLAVATVGTATARRLALAGPLLSLTGLIGCTVWLVGGWLPGAALSIAACGTGLGLVWPLLGQRMLLDEAAGADENARTMAMLSSVETLGYAIGSALVGLAGSLAHGLARAMAHGAARDLTAGAPADRTFDVMRAATAGMLVSMPLTLAGGVVCWSLLGRRRGTPGS